MASWGKICCLLRHLGDQRSTPSATSIANDALHRPPRPRRTPTMDGTIIPIYHDSVSGEGLQFRIPVTVNTGPPNACHWFWAAARNSQTCVRLRACHHKTLDHSAIALATRSIAESTTGTGKKMSFLHNFSARVVNFAVDEEASAVLGVAHDQQRSLLLQDIHRDVTVPLKCHAPTICHPARKSGYSMVESKSRTGAEQFILSLLECKIRLVSSAGISILQSPSRPIF